jgi:diguanylate cyclase
MKGQEENERTLMLAKTALGQIKALKQSAAPYFYEIWYNYATGHNQALNQTINKLISDNGNLTQADFERIHEHFFAPTKLVDQIDSAGVKFVSEIEQVVALLEAASGSAIKHTENLVSASDQLGRAKDREGVRKIVENLLRTSKEMEESNRRLEERLNQSREEIADLQASLEEVRAESLTDPLTGLANRKLLDEILDRSIAEAAANDEPLSLLLADIDHFKTFNDTYGHLTGDQVLRIVGLALKQNVMGRVAARYGGEEFAVVLPKTSLREAVACAEEIRRAVMGKELMKRSTGETLGRITISIGVATLQAGEMAGNFIGRADACLYAAKRNGRNRVICETDPEARGLAA